MAPILTADFIAVIQRLLNTVIQASVSSAASKTEIKKADLTYKLALRKKWFILCNVFNNVICAEFIQWKPVKTTGVQNWVGINQSLPLQQDIKRPQISSK